VPSPVIDPPKPPDPPERVLPITNPEPPTPPTPLSDSQNNNQRADRASGDQQNNQRADSQQISAEVGVLKIGSEPESVVFINGKNQKMTPFKVDLEPGKHTIEFVHPEHGEFVYQVTIESGLERTLVHKWPQRADSQNDSQRAENGEMTKGASDYKLVPADIKKVINASYGKVRTCVSDADVKGTLTLSWKVKGEGGVADVKVVSPEFENSQVGRCIVGVVQGLRFPAHNQDELLVGGYKFNVD
jgi:hypothetical protein